MEEGQKLNVQLRGQAADKFRRIKAYLGLENDTEVIRSLLAWYYGAHESELTGPPKMMWHINLDENGVLIWDPDIHRAVKIIFKPEGIMCDQDKTDNCKHVHFALAQTDIQEIIRKRRQEGWSRLPQV